MEYRREMQLKRPSQLLKLGTGILKPTKSSQPILET